MSLSFHRQPNTVEPVYSVVTYVPGHITVLGEVQRHGHEWVAVDHHGSWVSTTDRRKTAAQALEDAHRDRTSVPTDQVLLSLVVEGYLESDVEAAYTSLVDAGVEDRETLTPDEVSVLREQLSLWYDEAQS